MSAPADAAGTLYYAKGGVSPNESEFLRALGGTHGLPVDGCVGVIERVAKGAATPSSDAQPFQGEHPVLEQAVEQLFEFGNKPGVSLGLGLRPEPSPNRWLVFWNGHHAEQVTANRTGTQPLAVIVPAEKGKGWMGRLSQVVRESQSCAVISADAQGNLACTAASNERPADFSVEAYGTGLGPNKTGRALVGYRTRGPEWIGLNAARSQQVSFQHEPEEGWRVARESWPKQENHGVNIRFDRPIAIPPSSEPIKSMTASTLAFGYAGNLTGVIPVGEREVRPVPSNTWVKFHPQGAWLTGPWRDLRTARGLERNFGGLRRASAITLLREQARRGGEVRECELKIL